MFGLLSSVALISVVTCIINSNTNGDSTAKKVVWFAVLSIALSAICFGFFISGGLSAMGIPRNVRKYLYDGQVVRIRGLYKQSDGLNLLVEIKPGDCRLVFLYDDDYLICSHGEYVIGHYYRYFSGKLEVLPFGKDS